MKSIEKKSLDKPEEVRSFPNGKVELVKVGEVTFGKGTFQPGWKWSESIKPIAKTESCQVRHTHMQISGKLHVKMDDGTEMEFLPGDVGIIEPGHDAWVVGNDPVVMIDYTGMNNYARSKA